MSIPLKPLALSADMEKGRFKDEADQALLDDPESYEDSEDEEEGLAYELSLQDEPPKPSNARLWVWIVINVVSTVSIVFVNKAIFSTPIISLKSAQVSFAAFHFLITAIVLYILSRPAINVFEAKSVDVVRLLPLSLVMICNVVLQNAALANSSIQFNQVARVLLTPTCAALNFVMYRQTLSWPALLTLIPICTGVAVVCYFDTNTSGNADAKETTPPGVVFALLGVAASAVYTVWVKPFHEKLECNTWQLLLNQSVVSVGMMLYLIPITDNRWAWLYLSTPTWFLVILSGILASFINVSMFFVIHNAGAVNSTVVGHLKTCSIILLGWITSQKSFRDWSVVGFIMAIGGIITYSYITHKESKR